MTNLQEGNDGLNSSGVTDDPGNLANTVDALLAGPLADVAHCQLAADAVALKEDGVHGVGDISPVSVQAGLAACRVVQLKYVYYKKNKEKNCVNIC